MFNFKNDYSRLGHDKIIKKMLEIGNEDNGVYGLDTHSSRAKELIKEKLEYADVDIHFLVGGTIVNKTVIDHILRPYEAVIACDTGHINVHETGAIESTGHKVLTVPHKEGKITVDGIKSVLDNHVDEHMVLPKMVYISDSTELGGVYKKQELEDIYSFCKERNLYLFIDGARLGVALTSDENDIEIKDLCHLCDVFYIGATKNGAILGEAIVIINENLKKDFRFAIKQNGGMYSKGFVAGIQFEVLFEDDLYFSLARHSNNCAKLLKDGLKSLGLVIPYDSSTNQVFVSLNMDIVNKIKEFTSFEVWEKNEDEVIIRLVTSFASKYEEIEEFINILSEIIKN